MITIAIVEDEDFYAEQLTQYIEQYQKESEFQFKIIRFSDGDEIVKDYSAEYDIILMDIQMKFMNGIEVTDDVQPMNDEGVLMETLKAGSLDAVIMDYAVAENYAATGDFKVLEGSLLDEENYIITAEEGKEELMSAVNKAIAAFKESNDFNALVDKWFGSSAA